MVRPRPGGTRSRGAPSASPGSRPTAAAPCGSGSPQHPTHHSENTYSTVALRCCLSSGVLTSLLKAALLGPDAIARYCLPLTANVIGGAAKPEPTLIFH